MKATESPSTLGHLLSIIKGQVYDASLAGESGPFLLGMAIFSPDGGFRAHKVRRYSGEVRPEGKVPPGSVVVATTDMGANIKILGRSASVPVWVGDFAIATGDMGVVHWHTNDETLRAYAYWVMRTEVFRNYCLRFARGTAVRRIHPRDIEEFPISYAHVTHVRDILDALQAIDDKIELCRRMNATLEEVARALFRSWFVDFDPVRAKLDGLLPEGVDPATAALFPEHFEHLEGALLPTGWRHVTMEEICSINSWTLGKNDDLEMLEYIEISEVSRGNIANISTYPRGTEPSRARRRLRHGDTALSTVRPDRGAYFLALNPPENRVASTGFAVLTPTAVPWSFVHAGMTQPEISDHLGQMADGGAYPAVRPEVIGAMHVALPNAPKILEAFHRTCAPLYEKAEANRTQSRTLATLRDALLPKLLIGEVAAAQN